MTTLLPTSTITAELVYGAELLASMEPDPDAARHRLEAADQHCAIAGCPTEARALGMCDTHYRRMRPKKGRPVADRIEDIEDLLGLGASPVDVVQRSGIKPDSLTRALERAGRLDLAAVVRTTTPAVKQSPQKRVSTASPDTCRTCLSLASSVRFSERDVVHLAKRLSHVASRHHGDLSEKQRELVAEAKTVLETARQCYVDHVSANHEDAA